MPSSTKAQSTTTVLMIEPVRFFSNPSTRLDNAFQQPDDREAEKAQAGALEEFRGFRTALEEAGVKVQAWCDRADQNTPDSIFPNNWFSTHEGGTLVLYPMKSEMRRRERREDIVADLEVAYPEVIDLTPYEASESFLEGTGSLVLDRVHRVAYACYSPRTDPDLLDLWGKRLGYEICSFGSVDEHGQSIYHTNVMMSVGTGYAVLCAESIADPAERARVIDRLRSTGHEIVEISYRQMAQFCGNVLELVGRGGRKALAMSSTSWNGFTEEQRSALERYARLVHAPLATIEKFGGGGARCMLAELFPPA